MTKFQDTFGKSTTERKIKWEQELENKKYTNDRIQIIHKHQE
jgi:hypothetical protein